MKEKQPVVYITANKKYGVLYVGVTSDMVQRIHQHKQKTFKGFSAKYNCDLLVYYELHGTMEGAITREKQIKSGKRSYKLFLISSQNPEWRDLTEDIL